MQNKFAYLVSKNLETVVIHFVNFIAKHNLMRAEPQSIVMKFLYTITEVHTHPTVNKDISCSYDRHHAVYGLRVQ